MAAINTNDNTVTKQIVAHLATLYTNAKSGWTKEINMVSWNNAPAKLDIREWSPDHTKCSGRGITLNQAEVEMLKNVLNALPAAAATNPFQA